MWKKAIYCGCHSHCPQSHQVGLCQQQPECELHERPAEFPKAPMGAAASFSCFVCTHSVGINLIWDYLEPQHRRLLGSPASRGSSSAELWFTPACEPGQMGREGQRRRMKGNNQSCCHHSVVATGHLLGPMPGDPQHWRKEHLHPVSLHTYRERPVSKFCTHLCICSITVCNGFAEVEIRKKFALCFNIPLFN